MNGGTIDATSSGIEKAIAIGQTLNMNGGTITAKTPNGLYGIHTGDDSGSSGAINLNGGKITATVSPTTAVGEGVWSSSNTAVASVDESGKVTAKAVFFLSQMIAPRQICKYNKNIKRLRGLTMEKMDIKRNVEGFDVLDGILARPDFRAYPY